MTDKVDRKSSRIFPLLFKGGIGYYLWLSVLGIAIAAGSVAYFFQFRDGLIITGMRDPFPWGLYIGNFAFLVGVAAAAILVIIPAYLYHYQPLKEVCIVGEFLAASSIIMCLLFVVIDLGRPDRFLAHYPLYWPIALSPIHDGLGLPGPLGLSAPEPDHSRLSPQMQISGQAAEQSPAHAPGLPFHRLGYQYPYGDCFYLQFTRLCSILAPGYHSPSVSGLGIHGRTCYSYSGPSGHCPIYPLAGGEESTL